MVTIDDLREAPAVRVNCPHCDAESQAVELDTNRDIEAVFAPDGSRWHPALRGFQMACGCYLSATGWTLYVQIDPPRAWFEASR